MKNAEDGGREERRQQHLPEDAAQSCVGDQQLIAKYDGTLEIMRLS